MNNNFLKKNSKFFLKKNELRGASLGSANIRGSTAGVFGVRRTTTGATGTAGKTTGVPVLTGFFSIATDPCTVATPTPTDFPPLFPSRLSRRFLSRDSPREPLPPAVKAPMEGVVGTRADAAAAANVPENGGAGDETIPDFFPPMAPAARVPAAVGGFPPTCVSLPGGRDCFFRAARF